MKTPDEIKKGLKICYMGLGCEKCPYDTAPVCYDDMKSDSLDYIQQLELRLAHVERERDAAVQTVHGLCHHCKNGRSEKCQKCLFWPSRVYFVSTETYVDHWEWRGVCEENAKEES